MTKLKTSDGRIVISVPEILAEIEDFYGQLHASHSPQPQPDAKDHKATLTCHFKDDLPDVEMDKIETALGQLSNGKAPGEDEITSELQKLRASLCSAS